MSVKKWQKRVNGVGLISKKGRGGGTFAHKDIAFEFGTWISPKFKLLLIKEFQRLKEQEVNLLHQEWKAERLLVKRNYTLHTEAIKNHLLPQSTLADDEKWLEYASEADILNVALFGITAAQWRKENPENVKEGENIRDQAHVIQLLVLSNLEAINASLIREGYSKHERFAKLQAEALIQLGIFYRDKKLFRGLE